MLVRSLARARQLARLSRRSYSANRFDKEVASIVESSWKSGLAGSDMHTALIEQPVSRRGVLFNPWTLLLELLDDPRVVYNGGSEAGRILLSAIMWMGYLEKSVVRSRALFNCRFDLAAQSRLSIREGVEHAPGIVMNTILGWTGDLSHIISPAIEERICTQYFANIDTLRSTVADAWQLYDWLIHNNPHRETPLVLKRHFSLYKSRLATQMAENSSLSLMYRGLCAFDNLKEAQESLYRLNNVAINSPNSTGVRELDRKLVERLMYVKNM
ncbi:hypothetical protein J3F80_001217 [Coemansia sp. RSA 2526]|nr:hypothetical protein J3F80_001217 [Coemansia sp. RSA 2526]